MPAAAAWAAGKVGGAGQQVNVLAFAISRITSRKAFCAAEGSRPQLPGRTGQISTVAWWEANSAGMAKPSAAGRVESSAITKASL